MISNPYDAAVHDVFEEIWNAGHMEVADRLFTSNCVHEIPTAPEFGEGPEAHAAFVSLIRSGLHDFHVDIEDTSTEGNQVTVRWTATGIHRGRLMGIPPSGKKVTYSGTSLFRFEGNKIAEHRMDWESRKLMMQLANRG